MNLFRGDRQSRRSSLETSEKDGADTTDNLQSKWDILQNTTFDQIQFTLLALYHCHKPDLLHKWPLLQVCYRP